MGVTWAYAKISIHGLVRECLSRGPLPLAKNKQNFISRKAIIKLQRTRIRTAEVPRLFLVLTANEFGSRKNMIFFSFHTQM